MGQSISSTIKDIDGGDDAAKEMKDTLEALYELGKSRNEAAVNQATSENFKKRISANQILLQKQSIVVNASKNTDGITDGIKSSIGKLLQGQILDGVVDIIHEALKVVLGESSGRISQSYTYAIIATSLGALLRIDIDVYSFAIKSEGLQSKASDMTAITSIVSSVKIDELTLNDLRGIVSMSFGGSSIEDQKAIYEVIREAYVENKKNMKNKETGTEALSDEAQDRVRARFVPSKYEARMNDRAASNNGHGSPLIENGALTKSKVGRSDLEEFFQTHNNSVLANKFSNVSLDGKDAQSPGSKLEYMTEVFIWVKLTDQVEDEWLNQLTATLAGFNVNGMFQFGQLTGGRSGSAIVFQCQCNGEEGGFDLALRYINETVLPTMKTWPHLSRRINNTALQYTHPSEDENGLVTLVTFYQNNVINQTATEITFFQAKTMNAMGTIGAYNKDGFMINGTVHHISANTKKSEGKERKEGEPEPEPETEKWVTYQKVAQDAIPHVSISVSDLPEGGYRLTMYSEKAHTAVYIDYNKKWTN